LRKRNNFGDATCGTSGIEDLALNSMGGWSRSSLPSDSVLSEVSKGPKPKSAMSDEINKS